MLDTTLALAEISLEKENSPRESSWMFNVSKCTNNEMIMNQGMCSLYSQEVFYSFNADPPDVAEVVLEDEPVKGEEVQLSCFLEDPGNPLATEFLWQK